MYVCIYVFIHVYIIGHICLYIIDKVSPVILPPGQLHILTESELVDNIANLHVINDRNMHPAGMDFTQAQAQSLELSTLCHSRT